MIAVWWLHRGGGGHGERTCRPRDHSGTPPDERSDQTNDKGSIETHERCNTSDKGKGNGGAGTAIEKKGRRLGPMLAQRLAALA